MGKFMNITGQRYGKLTVKSYVGKSKWLCVCDCGNETVVRQGNLTGCHTKSCGCYKTENIIGKKFGRLVVIQNVGKNKRNHNLYLCKCDCGNEKIICSGSIKSGNTKSCGCLTKEIASQNNRKHGKRNTKLYSTYNSMKQRCANIKDKYAHIYSLRNIKVCEEWLGENGFLNFYEWAINNGYKEYLSIDRIDNNKGYSPDNCRWVTMETQQNNRRNNRLISYKGETKTLSQWAKSVNINVGCLWSRLKNGWDIEKALFAPKRGKENNNV